MSTPSEPSPSALVAECREAITTALHKLRETADSLDTLASGFDHLGNAAHHPEGSAGRRFAELRDHADHMLSIAASDLDSIVGARALTSHSVDLVADTVCRRCGDADDAIKLIDLFHERFGDEREPDGSVGPETFPDSFLWDLYHRVSALPGLVERYPMHLRHAASQMHGWPILACHHLDHTADFHRVSELLGLGSAYPLGASPRKKKGAPNPALDYLEPLVWRLHVLRIGLIGDRKLQTDEPDAKRIEWLWSYGRERISTSQIEILARLTALPPLSTRTVKRWVKSVILPYVLEADGADPGNSGVPLIRNTWAQRTVKSQATFRSRLESRITSTLERYARPEDP